MTPTLEDVARRAQVSTATVSRCLNTPEKVVSATRARVNEAIEALGYAPHFGARAMAAKRSNTIGAIIPTMENAIFAEGLQAFQETLSAAGYDLLVASSSYSLKQEAAQIRSLVARGADGLLLVGQDRDPGVKTFMAQRNLPVVTAWSVDVTTNRPAVGFDNFAAMHELAQEVLAQGHRQIGYITAPVAQNDRTNLRLKAVRHAMEAAGGKLSIIETTYGIETGAEAFATLMAQIPRPTAVMCANDVLAVGALTQAREMGLRVPQDVSLTGFDDMALSRVVNPPLTTVRVPNNAMGRTAAEMLLGIVERAENPAPICLETRLLKRGSLGPLSL